MMERVAAALANADRIIDRHARTRERARIKAAALADAIEAHGLPLVFDYRDGRVASVVKMRRLDGAIRLHIEWTLDGERQPFDNPWFIGNPPLNVSPLDTLREIIDEKCRRPGGSVKGRG